MTKEQQLFRFWLNDNGYYLPLSKHEQFALKKKRKWRFYENDRDYYREEYLKSEH